MPEPLVAGLPALGRGDRRRAKAPKWLSGIAPCRSRADFRELQARPLSAATSAPSTPCSDVSLTIRRGEFIALLGPSGCGKSTALNCIAGLLPPTGGGIWLDDKRIDALRPEERGFGMVFQNYALFPHMSVRKNIGFGLAMRGVPQRRGPSAASRRRSASCASRARSDKLPGQLSGGQQQRVAIARAIVVEPPLVLMDEPLSNLDAKLRLEMRAEIRRIHNALGATTIYVTHDQEEALSLADRIVVLREARSARSARRRSSTRGRIISTSPSSWAFATALPGTRRAASSGGRAVGRGRAARASTGRSRRTGVHAGAPADRRRSGPTTSIAGRQRPGIAATVAAAEYPRPRIRRLRAHGRAAPNSSSAPSAGRSRRDGPPRRRPGPRAGLCAGDVSDAARIAPRLRARDAAATSRSFAQRLAARGLDA